MRIIFTGLATICILLIVSCANPYKAKPTPKPTTRVDRSDKIIPRAEPKSKYGNPSSYVVFGKRYYVLPSSKGYVAQGVASWYGTKFHGRRTSSGETYDMYAMTAAHKTLPLPTYARVTNKRNGRSIIVRINDRGPFHQNRLIDLSYTAATKLGIVTRGTGLVEVQALDPRLYARQVSKSKSAKTKIVDVAEPEIAEKKTVATTSNNVREKPVEIFVQIGAFRVRENAQKFSAQFAGLSVGKVGVYESVLEESPIYKVRIGPLDSVTQADKAVEMITQLGHSDYKLVFEDESI